jgi:hypothetical protein
MSLGPSRLRASTAFVRHDLALHNADRITSLLVCYELLLDGHTYKMPENRHFIMTAPPPALTEY